MLNVASREFGTIGPDDCDAFPVRRKRLAKSALEPLAQIACALRSQRPSATTPWSNFVARRCRMKSKLNAAQGFDLREHAAGEDLINQTCGFGADASREPGFHFARARSFDEHDEQSGVAHA